MMLVALVAAACLPVGGPRITAKDVAAAVVGFVPQNPDAVLGYSPMPGVERLVHPGELQRFLTEEHFTGVVPPSDVCFARPVSPVTEEAARKAMLTALGSDARIEIVELSRFPAPAGALVFPRESIGAPPVALWRGYVLYDGDKKFPVWARVKLSVRALRLIAKEDLRPGVPIKAEQLSLESIEEFPSPRVTPPSIEKAAGFIPRRFISAKSPVWVDSIDPPNDIAKGDRVAVTVHSGRAQLTFDAEAESSGRRGDLVAFKNPESGKVFRARVEGASRALVETPSFKP